jgi:hypothetical protein
MLNVFGPLQTSAASGGAGVATGTITSGSQISGRVVGAYVKYLDSPPAGTADVVIETAGVNHPVETILSIANAATDGWFYPKTASHLNTSGAAIANEYQNGVPVQDAVKVTLAQANDNDYVQVWLFVDNG